MRQQFVTLTSAQTITGIDYTDNRKNYIGRAGLLIINQTEDGKDACSFFILDSNNNIARFAPAPGQLVETDTDFTVRTVRSVYAFSKAYELSLDDQNAILEAIKLKQQ